MQNHRIVGYLVLFLLLAPGWGCADLYYWIDKEGVKHFSNDPPSNRENVVKKTDEIVREEKEQPPKELDSPDLSKDSNRLKKIESRQKRVGTGPKVNIKFKYYDFVSVNINDIIGVMWKKSPIRHDGQSYSANTNYHISCHYHTGKEDGTWYIDRVSTKVDVIFTMPRWADYPKANRDQQQKWDKYYASLMTHENGHKDIAIEGAREIENELLKLNYTNEKYLKAAADSITRRIYAKVRVLQKQFDEKTEHGLKTGVVLH